MAPRLPEALGGPLAQQHPEERPPFIALLCPQEGRGGSTGESPSLQWELTHNPISEGHHLPNVMSPARPALPAHSGGHPLSQGLTPGPLVRTTRPRENEARKSYSEAFLQTRRIRAKLPKPHLSLRAGRGGRMGRVAEPAFLRSVRPAPFLPSKDAQDTRGAARWPGPRPPLRPTPAAGPLRL